MGRRGLGQVLALHREDACGDHQHTDDGRRRHERYSFVIIFFT
ncbi:hypothetical protein [Umezawaea tangerina]|nr:hypothetical protein [Umezawaea tangerina]